MPSISDPLGLLRAYGFEGYFRGLWVSEADEREIAVRLRVDPSSELLCDRQTAMTWFSDISEHGEVVWAGVHAPGWTQIISLSGHVCGRVNLQRALSEGGRRVLAVGWTDIDGPTELLYAENGQLVDHVTPYHPDPASLGYALSPYLREVPFSESADSEVTLNSFLKVVEKVTGGAISNEWFETVHNLYRIPKESWLR
ncbi:hypothetical protein AB0K18_48465 [Nonomuraea sp. NPDC049421]|uniref:hypothetical protein n=1 Tax=Nonomuraea sp. NPDC049421 TaxID=3155275 RepID=UPI0034159043